MAKCSEVLKCSDEVSISVVKFSWVKCDPGVDSASNRNEYQEYFLWVKAIGA